MFETIQQKIALGVFVVILLTIPIGSYLVSQRTSSKTSASQTPSKDAATESTITSDLSPLDEIKKLTDALNEPLPSPEQEDNEVATASTFGPTLAFKLILEGRPQGKQASKVFVGISDPALSSPSNPKYLLSFTIDLPDSGIFTTLSLSGLTVGTRYNTYIKPSAQIATSSAFTMASTTSYLNNDQPLTLLTGDLNEDNAINSADYSIAKSALGSTPQSTNWNDNTDFNKDGVVNSLDLAFIAKNMAKEGESGVWISTPATQSAALKQGLPMGGVGFHPSGSSGYWMWVPQ